MKSGFRLGRLFGISIIIDWSWILIFVLVSWNLSVTFGAGHQDWGAGLQWGLAFTAALIFFASVLAHEIAHSLVARLSGISVKSITLFLFGGVSNIQREPSSPLADFLIAIVGPLTSFLLGFIFLVWAWLLMPGGATSITDPAAGLSQLDPFTTMLLWLGSVNLVVGAFNLIPGYPLDGGRVVRSVIWKITEELRTATRWAAFLGQGIAWMMILAGIAMFFGANVPYIGTGLSNGIWLAFIGWFLNSAAVQSYQQTVVQDILEDVQVNRLMNPHPEIVTSNLLVESLVSDYILRSGDEAYPVMSEDGQVLEGLVTLDHVRKISREKWKRLNVKDIMTPFEKLFLVNPEEEATEALRFLSKNEVKQLLVVRGRELIGILRRRDILRWLQVFEKRT